MRHLARGTNVPMYRTSWRCRSAGRMSGPLVVSMRPVPAELVGTAVPVTARYPAVPASRLPLAITHEPGQMLITDARDGDYRI